MAIAPWVVTVRLPLVTATCTVPTSPPRTSRMAADGFISAFAIASTTALAREAVVSGSVAVNDWASTVISPPVAIAIASLASPSPDCPSSTDTSAAADESRRCVVTAPAARNRTSPPMATASPSPGTNVKKLPISAAADVSTSPVSEMPPRESTTTSPPSTRRAEIPFVTAKT